MFPTFGSWRRRLTTPSAVNPVAYAAFRRTIKVCNIVTIVALGLWLALECVLTVMVFAHVKSFDMPTEPYSASFYTYKAVVGWAGWALIGLLLLSGVLRAVLLIRFYSALTKAQRWRAIVATIATGLAVGWMVLSFVVALAFWAHVT